VRKDIPLAAQIVQTGHACLEAGEKFSQPHDKPGFLIVLAVPSEESLIDAVEQINQRGIQTVVFFEPDNQLGYSAACTQPVTEPQRGIFRKYPLWDE
jgi:hypothetical protein